MKTLAITASLIFSTAAFAAQNFYQLGTYEVTTHSLACNVSPQPCYDTYCQLLIIPRGTTFEAVDVVNQDGTWEDRPWFYTNYNCWVRASADYLRKLGGGFVDSMYVPNPPSNVRYSPNGPVQCVIRAPRWIGIFDYSNGWYRTDACGSTGFIHESQVSW